MTEAGRVQLQVRLDPRLRARLKHHAQARQVSVNLLASAAIQEKLERLDREEEGHA